MKKTLLIHGYAVHLTAPLLRRGFGDHAGFRAFEKQITEGQAQIFRWGNKMRVASWQLINPWFMKRFYEAERACALEVATLRRLADALQKQQPCRIVAHSMGCNLLQVFLRAHTLPDSVQDIILIQSNLSRDDTLQTNAHVLNLYCPWDPTLILSSILHRKLRMGLALSGDLGIEDRLMPLTKMPNLHLGSIQHPRIHRWTESE